MKEFKKLYLWAMNAKLMMAMYFLTLVFLTSFVSIFQGKFELRILHLFQMLLLSIVIALTQVVYVDQYLALNKGLICLRTVLWLAFSVSLTFLTSKIFAWFPQAPTWGPPLLTVFMILVLTMMLLGNHWEQEADTLRLNRGLGDFKSKGGF